LIPLLILAAALLVTFGLAWSRGGSGLLFDGLNEGASLLMSVAPQLLIGFLLAGMMTVLLPADTIADWLGADSGMRGLVIATVAGTLTPGGPFLQFPLVASLANAGAAPGPLAAYVTAWSLVGVNRLLVWEVPLLGPQFALVRWSVSLALPILVGLAVPVVLRLTVRGS
jgi:uncharacterized membrane protein YraQ (UPF0718 family)